MKKMKLLFVILTIAGLGVAGLAAQSSSDQQYMASKLRINQEEIHKYTWNSTYTYSVDGVEKVVEEYSVKYFPDGTQQKMQIGGHTDKEKVRGIDGKKLKKKEREAGHDFVMKAKNQLDAYLNPMYSEKAISTATVTTKEDSLVFNAHDVVSRSDTVEIHLSLPNYLPTTAAIKTHIDGSPVTLDIEFETPEIGPSYPKRSITTATWQGLHLTITTENSNYQRD